MPNGFHGPKEEWDRMEAPLLRVDPEFEAFAKSHALQHRRKYHNWPERSLIWNTENVRKLIQVFLKDEKELKFTVWVCAFEDRGAKRFWKQKKLKEAVLIEEVLPELSRLLVECKVMLDDWKGSDPEPVKE